MRNHAFDVILIFHFLFVLGCATAGPVTAGRIRTDMASIRQDVAVNRNAITLLRNKRVGKTGFYYVVDSDGRVVFHPQAALIGSSFRDHWVINQLLSEKTGCLTYQLGNRKHLVFYEPLNESEILCLSIISDDIVQLPADCRQAEIK